MSNATQTSGYEAYGVVGTERNHWRQTFESKAALAEWIKKTEVEVHAIYDFENKKILTSI